MSRNPLLNTLFSFILPGVGQFLNGEEVKGAIFLVIFLILNFSIYFVLNNPFGHVVSTAYRLYAGYDAYVNF